MQYNYRRRQSTEGRGTAQGRNQGPLAACVPPAPHMLAQPRTLACLSPAPPTRPCPSSLNATDSLRGLWCRRGCPPQLWPTPEWRALLMFPPGVQLITRAASYRNHTSLRTWNTLSKPQGTSGSPPCQVGEQRPSAFRHPAHTVLQNQQFDRMHKWIGYKSGSHLVHAWPLRVCGEALFGWSRWLRPACSPSWFRPIVTGGIYSSCIGAGRPRHEPAWALFVHCNTVHWSTACTRPATCRVLNCI